MPRQRILEPSFFSDDLICELPIEVAYMYMGTWVFADDYGNIIASPAQWRLWIFPCRGLSIEQIKEWQKVLLDKGRIIPYQVEGKNYFHIPTLARRLSKLTKRYTSCPRYEKSELVQASPDKLEEVEQENRGKRIEVRGKNKTMGVPPHSLEGWIERVRTASNSISELGEMMLLLSDGKEMPDYARLGKMAKEKKPGYMAKLIWDCASARPLGSWLDYIQKMKKPIEEPDLGTRIREF